MSGLEIILIIGAGVLITKKVRERRERKKNPTLTGHGVAQTIDSSASQSSRPRGLVARIPNREGERDGEALPMYVPRENDNGTLADAKGRRSGFQQMENAQRGVEVGGELPTYDELHGGETDLKGKKKRGSERWKLWK